MKNIFFCAAVVLCGLSAGCKHGNTIISNDGNNYLEIRYSGEIKFTEDETAIESMSNDAFLNFRYNNKKLTAGRNYHGEIEYRLYDDGKKVDPYDEQGEKLIAEAIQKMMDVGFNAEERLRHIYERGGGIALLKATLKVQGDFLKGMYLSYLIARTEPGAGELVAAAQIVALDMANDFEKAQVLKKFPDHSLQDQRIAEEWLKAAGTINPAFEKSQVLKVFPLGKVDNPEVCVTWIAIAKTIDADFEKAQVLKEFPVQKLDNSLVSAAWFEAIRTINADFEKTNTLKILANQPLNNEQFSEVLVTAGGINAAFEQVNLIKELIDQKVPSAPEPFEQLMVLVRNIDADFEKANLLKAIAEKNIEAEAQWSGIIRETKGINTDFEKAGVLLLIAEKMPKTDPLNNAYMDAAKTIQSEMDYGRVVKAVQ